MPDPKNTLAPLVSPFVHSVIYFVFQRDKKQKVKKWQRFEERGKSRGHEIFRKVGLPYTVYPVMVG